MNNTAYVAIDRCESYNQDEIYSCLKELCIQAHMPSVEGKKVLVKPNILSDAKPENCITTHPEVFLFLRFYIQNDIETVVIRYVQ